MVILVLQALGSKSLAAEKAIVTRLASIEEVAGMNMLCSDKTGTLTKARLPIRPFDITRDDALSLVILQGMMLFPF